MELKPENFPRPPPDPPQTWLAYDDMVKWEKETAYTGDNLYFDWVTSWLNPVPNVAAAQAPSDVAAANQVPVQRARQRLTNRRLPQQTLPETAAADQQASNDFEQEMSLRHVDTSKSDSMQEASPPAEQITSPLVDWANKPAVRQLKNCHSLL